MRKGVWADIGDMWCVGWLREPERDGEKGVTSGIWAKVLCDNPIEVGGREIDSD